MQTENLLNTREAANYLCVSTAFLERDRWAGASVPFIRVGSRAVRYQVSDLDAFIQTRRMASQSNAVGVESTPTAAAGDDH